MKPRWWMPTLALFVAIGLGGVYWRGADEQAAVGDANQGPLLLGEVADLAGRPIAGARVHVDGVDREAITDAHGRFRFGAVAAGTHVVRVSAPSYADDEQAVDVPRDAAQADVAFRLRLDVP